ncbi:MAG: sulfur reduction protein DsrE [Marinobacter sp. 34-60-7]|nr:MAG: sulfur reduction protein DsrE [Marinobacter sp. 34-60-7]
MTTLIVVDQAPYGSWNGREALDMALSLAAFDQPVALLFTGPGVNWLRAGQNPALIEQKSVEKQLGAAGIFGVEALYADQTACQRFQLAADDLMPGITPCDNAAAVISQHQRVLFAG